ncbi:MAG: hypothetical protein IJU86_05005 [Firmicutes bacterium]|nr:hypothetical protein [Bacillota bacterium]
MAEESSESSNSIIKIKRRRKGKLSSGIERIKKIYDGWLNIRAKVEEIMEPVLFFGGGALTALIALGILPWGALGIGICATLTFIGISRFVLTNSWTWWHNRWAEGQKENENEGENTGNDNEEEEKEESNEEKNNTVKKKIEIYQTTDEEYEGEANNKQKKYEEDVNKGEKKQGTGFVKSYTILPNVKTRVSPIILAVAGIVFGVLGAIGVLGLGLALGIAIPSLILVAMALVLIGREERFKMQTSNNFWGVSMLVAGLLSVATFAVLGLTGVLALPTAIALGAPGLVLAGSMALIFVGTCIGFWVKNREKEADEEKEPCIFIGLSFNPEWLVSKKEEVENKIIEEDSDELQYSSRYQNYD